ncbi:UbiH/UbiF/VisC/COQ6 family ubiquinone biosynthesis hydroxylase [Glaciecola siphonariae]|uniref:UbiH/UbiF/VisC/COQ6 family ubiquinone biosynthesis hydroxylase n=1 Tax=Glaciecola siphonariae TaxID=521012 RepID=A0ABV9LVC1_9ALTE
MSASKKHGLIIQADVVIAGAGIVGQTLALLLANIPETQALSVVVIDTQDLSAVKTSEQDSASGQPEVFSPRVSAISHASQQIFESLGAWQHIARKQPYTSMHVWEQDSFAGIDFHSDEIGLDALGNIIENEQITLGLYRTASAVSSIQYLMGSPIEQMQLSNGEYQLQLGNGQLIVAKLVVGADGANSFVRQNAGFVHTFWDYDQTAIVANVNTSEPHTLCARQAFTPTGPLAFLPLADSFQCSIVWSQDTQAAEDLMALDDTEFCKSLGRAIDMKLGLCSLSTERFSYPLRMRYARQWVDESVALIGDAAHTIHPLAGQGANLGIGDAQALAHNIAQSIQANKPFYSKQQLRKYERARKAQAQKAIAAMEGFKRLFSGSDPLKKLLRSTGLYTANKLNPVKQFFIQQAET